MGHSPLLRASLIQKEWYWWRLGNPAEENLRTGNKESNENIAYEDVYVIYEHYRADIINIWKYIKYV